MYVLSMEYVQICSFTSERFGPSKYEITTAPEKDKNKATLTLSGNMQNHLAFLDDPKDKILY